MKKGKFLNCIVCKKEFYIRPYLLNGNRFCSRKCYGLNKQKREQVKCLNCGKFKIIKISDIKRGRKFCSQVCAVNWWKGKPRKYTEENRKRKVLNLGTRMLNKKHSLETRKLMSENSAMYKGGVTKLSRHIRTITRYLEWRMSVFIRDNFTCRRCGELKSGHLQAHHVKPLSKIIEENLNQLSTFEGINNCKELWSISNGITVCDECHKEIDKFYKRFFK